MNLSRNKITSLPPDLATLYATELSLNQNQVTAIPGSLARSPRLRTLRLEENCIGLEGIPKELLSDSQVREGEGGRVEKVRLSIIDGIQSLKW